MLTCELTWIWCFVQSLVEIRTVVHQHISAISYYLPLEKGVALHLNEFDFPSHRDPLCPVCLKFSQWFPRERFFNFVNVFSLFCFYLPLGRVWLFIEQIWMPSHKGILIVPIWLKVKRSTKIWKFMTTAKLMTRSTDNGQKLMKMS